MSKTLILALALLPGPAGAAEAAKDTIQMVEYFLKTPIADLPAGSVEQFLAVDPESLPKKLRERYKGRRLELYTLKRVAQGKKKGTLRTPEPDCDAPKDAKSGEIGVLKAAGYEELFETDLVCIERESKCTPHDLMCEFTLQIFVEKKGKKKISRFFMYKSDVMMGIVAVCRDEVRVGKQTNFFGVMKPLCQH
ncbi:MAG: hypothetical protein HY077_01120 [Elusimicrobia bacterium]|nr:hypothetical protein [Elusimicrobiota bacterium]